MPRAFSSRASDSSPATRNESSFDITSAATFLPAKEMAPASSDLNVEVNLISAESAATRPAATVAVIAAVRQRHFILTPYLFLPRPRDDVRRRPAQAVVPGPI